MRDFRTIVKTLICAIEMTRKAVRLSASRLVDAQKDRVEQVLLSSEGQCLAANALMERIQEHFDVTLRISEDQIRKRQEAAVKLLTWIACIFLPLSTASSLLSMSSRAKDIGSVWWDWLSIVFIAGLMVLLGYTWAMKSFALRHSSFFFHWQRVFTDAKRDTLNNHERQHIVHPGVRFLFIFSICAFTLGAVTAFLIGMFVRVETGATALGWSVAGALGLMLAPLLIWRFVNLFLWFVQSIRSRSWIWPIHLPDKTELSPRRLKIAESPKRRFITSTSIVLCLLVASGLMLFPVLLISLFTGSMIFEVLYRMKQVHRKRRKNMDLNKNPKKDQGKMEMVEGMEKKDEGVDVEQNPASQGQVLEA